MEKIRQYLVALVMAAGLALVASGAYAESDTGAAMGEMALGRADAPVTVIEYASMTCPHCARFHAEVLPDFKKKYIDTGKVRLVFREFPLDKLAFAAAKVARCGGKKRFFPLLSVIFSRQGAWSRSTTPVDDLAKLARLAGVGRDRFEACFADRALGDLILKNRLEAVEKYKIDSTPSFVIDGKTYPGVLTVKDFDRILKDLIPAS